MKNTIVKMMITTIIVTGTFTVFNPTQTEAPNQPDVKYSQDVEDSFNYQKAAQDKYIAETIQNGVEK